MPGKAYPLSEVFSGFALIDDQLVEGWSVPCWGTHCLKEESLSWAEVGEGRAASCSEDVLAILGGRQEAAGQCRACSQTAAQRCWPGVSVSGPCVLAMSWADSRFLSCELSGLGQEIFPVIKKWALLRGGVHSVGRGPAAMVWAALFGTCPCW